MNKSYLLGVLLPLCLSLVATGCGDSNGDTPTQYTIRASAGAGGSIAPEGEVKVNSGSSQNFSISPDSGYGIKDVLVDDNSVGVVASYSFQDVTSDHTIMATFEQGLSLTVAIEGSGTVVKDPDQDIYETGDQVTLTATAEDTWAFVGWEGDVTGSSNPVTVIMNSSKVVTARFAQGQQYVLAVTVDGQGDVTKDPDQAAYEEGTVVTLTAAAGSDWAFDHWEGDAVGTDNPVQVTMDADKSVTAKFLPSECLLAVYVDGGGEVAVEDDLESYDCGDSVTLTATADAGWVFDHWEGDASGSDNPLLLPMDGYKIVTAYFTQETFPLNLTVDGAGSVSLDPDLTEFTYGTLVTLTAVPDAGNKFDRWEGAVTGTSNPVQLVIDGAKDVSAFFVLGEYTLTTDVDGSGSVTRDPDQASYSYGTQVALTAVPDPGWEFDHWEGDATGTDNPVTVTVNTDMTATAHFTQMEFFLNVTLDGSGSVTLDPDAASYASGTVVTLTAVPDAGAVFDRWEGDLSGSDNPQQITMDADKNVTAFFVAPSILLVDDDAGGSYQGDYQAALDILGYSYDDWDVNSSGSPGQSDLMSYDVVIWFCSDEFQNQLTTTDQTNLAAYLDAGGRFFISAMELLQDGQTSFTQNYLHVQSYTQDANASSAVATDDEISNGLGSVSLSYPYTDFTDGLTPDASASASFENPSGQTIAIKAAADDYKTVFFGFPFEAISDAPTAAAIMDNVIEWLLE